MWIEIYFIKFKGNIENVLVFFLAVLTFGFISLFSFIVAYFEEKAFFEALGMLCPIPISAN